MSYLVRRYVLLSHTDLSRTTLLSPIVEQVGTTHYKQLPTDINPIALRTAKTLWSFGSSECNRLKMVTMHS